MWLCLTTSVYVWMGGRHWLLSCLSYSLQLSISESGCVKAICSFTPVVFASPSFSLCLKILKRHKAGCSSSSLGFWLLLPLREAAGAWKSQPQPTEAPKSGEGRERETVLVVKKKKKRKEIAWFKKRTTASTIQKVRLKQPVQINKELCKDEEWRRKYNEANKG